MSKKNSTIAKRLESLRKKDPKNSREKLGIELKIQPDRIWRLESGQTNLKASELYAYSERFGVSRDWIMTGEDQEEIKTDPNNQLKMIGKNIILDLCKEIEGIKIRLSLFFVLDVIMV